MVSGARTGFEEGKLMLDWVFLMTNHLGRGEPKQTARLLPHLPWWYVRRLSEARLLRVLRHVHRRSPAQRQRWLSCGIRRHDLRSVDVLQHIPFTTSGDITLHPEDYYCAPREKLIHVISTSGTKGQAKKLYLTTRDIDDQARLFGTKLCLLPGASRVLAIFALDHATWCTGAIARRGIEKAGMFGLLSSCQRDAPYQIGLIREYDIDTIITTPTTVHRLTLDAKIDLRQLGIRYLILSTQPWSEAFRRTVESAWGATTIDSYGTNEFCGSISAECPHQNGLHISAVDFWVEIVEAESGKPLGPGEEGEVVVTTLARRGMPLIRYRTGDLAHLLPDDGRCACGWLPPKMSRIRGRIDDMLILGAGGVNVYPDEFDEAILSLPGVSDYQVTVQRDGYKDILHLTVETDQPVEEMREALVTALTQIPNVRRACEDSHTLEVGRLQTVRRGTLSEGRTKGVRIIDKR